MNVGIVAQRENPRAADLAEDLLRALREDDADTVLDVETADSLGRSGVPLERMHGADLIVSIGGDGTFLFVARELGDIPILGVNLGEVGFLNAVSPTDAISSVKSVVREFHRSGSIRSSEVARLSVSGKDWTLSPALNEIVIQGAKRGHGGGCTVVVSVDGSTYLSGHADGVLVATATGSTAYNLSERGPLVHPSVPGMVITPMCAIDTMPSIVIDIESEVTVSVSEAERSYVVADGRDRVSVDPPHRVSIRRAESSVNIAGPSVNFFEALGKLD